MSGPSVRFEAAEGAIRPSYATPGSAGADLSAFLSGDLAIEPGKRALVPTGLRIEIPEGYEAQIRPRSGIALKSGVTCLNSPGTIDADYRGEIGVILVNHGEDTFTVHNGDRIAQMVIARVERVVWESCAELRETARGPGGFGSTGL